MFLTLQLLGVNSLTPEPVPEEIEKLSVTPAQELYVMNAKTLIAARVENCRLFAIMNIIPVGLVQIKIFDYKVVLNSFFIDWRFQGCGYGTKALDLTLKLIKSDHPGLPIEVYCYHDNTRALSMYRKAGFIFNDNSEGNCFVTGRRENKSENN